MHTIPHHLKLNQPLRFGRNLETEQLDTTAKVGPRVIDEVEILMTGIDPFDAAGERWFENQTKAYIEDYFNADDNIRNSRSLLVLNQQTRFEATEKRELDSLIDLTNIIEKIEVTIDIIKMDPPYEQNSRNRMLKLRNQRYRRKIQSKELTLTYKQTVTYYTKSSEPISLQDIVEKPFGNIKLRLDYKDALMENQNQVFQNLDTISIPTITEKNDQGSNIGIIVGVSCAGGFVLLVFLFLCYRYGIICSKNSKDEDEFDVKKQPPSSLNVPNNRNDKSKTIVEPIPRGEDIHGNESVGTDDYDYTRVYAGGGDTTVSSAGGTLGSKTRQTKFSGADTFATPVQNSNEQNLFSDDRIFDENLPAKSETLREVVIEIEVPPGKLGVVIDTPDDGAPVVHAIKDSSCIADKLRVGDKLMYVDEEDVRSMTAIRVSKLISKKSNNSKRIFTVVRTTVINIGD
eukprot:CAMPEP_0184868470 /NCGR_PEP_ID=MMETSP0580-20130426/30559_1 /TAXON_ID=1118495 /ORGANISM="Dactyliosolen fragilissimus" /LENGTH=457 /DNA_ID=CAMNT_0027369387 /DNA_START=457 /DNA_END=1830 /DNA_ORIENTATION=-